MEITNSNGIQRFFQYNKIRNTKCQNLSCKICEQAPNKSILVYWKNDHYKTRRKRLGKSVLKIYQSI